MSLTDEGLVAVPGFASRWVRLPSGAKCHYMTAGDDGPSVVLLHGGLPGSSGLAGWRWMAPFLAQNGFRVYCPDMPGYGLSDPAVEHRPAGLHSHVDFIHDFTTTLCLDRFHLAGNSMGCMNTVNYTTAHPERVVSFALIAGAVGDIVGPEVERVPGPFRLTPYDGTAEHMRGMMDSIILNGQAISDDLIEMRVRASKPHMEHFYTFFRAVLEYGSGGAMKDPNIRARLSTKGRFDTLTIPGIYLYGMQDVLAPVENGYLQEDRLPNIQFFYPEGTGHQGQTDQPELHNQIFLELFRDGRVSRATADAGGVSTRRPELANLVEQP
jgi:2-hydroxy-6-oxonona-2,4-dienedioate hydrolase